MADHPELGAHLFRFAIISDTHVNPEEEVCNSPFPVNAKANRRFRHVVADLNQREIDFVVHLGDLVHPVPETGDLYTRAAEAFRTIEAGLDIPVSHVPGNHDIGDTPVKGAPASPTTEAMIVAWENEFGEQYQAFSHKDVRFILLNAQLINSGLPDEAHQAKWLEAELANANGRVMIMLHHPPYLCFPEEPSHYDNTDPPGRHWLLDLVREYRVEAMFAGHAHNFWYDRFGETDYYLAPSTCFVRQDYSEMLRVQPPSESEFGRDDSAKLGYFLVNVFGKGHTVQFARTFGKEVAPDGESTKPITLAPPPLENLRPRIGFDLRQNWAEISEVPPSGGLDEFDRKSVRNDYPLLALIEMGVRDIRIPFADLRDPARCKRLRSIYHLGLRPTIFNFGVPSEDDLALIKDNRDIFCSWEMTVDWSALHQMQDDFVNLYEQVGLPIYLSRMRSKADLAAGSLYFHVINHGFTLNDLSQLDELNRIGLAGVEGVIFRMGIDLPVSSTLLEIDKAVCERGLQASVHMRTAGDNPAEGHNDHDQTCERVRDALNITPDLTSTRLFLDTLSDNDRGYFPRHGAIDRAGNPNHLLDIIRKAHIET